MTAREITGSFIDGCHRYGWVITIVTNLLALGYFTGGLNQRVIDIQSEVQILKGQVNDLSTDVQLLKTQVYDLSHKRGTQK